MTKKDSVLFFSNPGAARLKNMAGFAGVVREREKIKTKDYQICVSKCLGSFLQRRQLSLSIGSATISKRTDQSSKENRIKVGSLLVHLAFNDAGPARKCSAVSRTARGFSFGSSLDYCIEKMYVKPS